MRGRRVGAGGVPRMVPPVTLAAMRRTAAVRLGAAAVAVAAVLAACGGGDDSKAVSSGKDKPAATSTPSAGGTGSGTTGGTGTTGTAACTLPGAATTAQSTAATTPVALLTDLTYAVHDGCDRIVFQFRDGDVPGYQVGYKPGPFNKGESDEPLEVQGAAYLVVRFDKAAGVDLTSPNAMPTYTGPRTITMTGLTHVDEIVNAEDFEGVLTWVVGLDAQRPFAVSTLSSPPRVVVDLS